MTVRVYRSTDASAPVLTGQVGSLTSLLDAILVNGYGALTAAGWTINQTTTNKRGYKQNLTGANNSSGMLLYVDDTGPGAGTAKEARVCGFETMSAITPTGTGQFPTSAQSVIGTGGFLVVRKSTTADATARAWTCVANGQTIYLFIESGDSTAPFGATSFCFGDFKSYKTSDQYAVMIIGRQTENSGATNVDALQALNLPGTNAAIAVLNTTMYGHYICRSWTGIGGSVKAGKPSDMSRVTASNNVGGGASGAYSGSEGQTTTQGGGVALGRNGSANQWPAPNGPDGALVLAPVYLSHSFAIRGYLLGLWQSMHDRPLGHNDSFTVTGGNLNGKSLLAQNIQAYVNAVADAAQAIVETSDTWG